jgi:hypothetical protein
MIHLLDFLVGDVKTSEARHLMHDELLRMINCRLIYVDSSGFLYLPSVIMGNHIAETTDTIGTLVFSSNDFSKMPSYEIVKRIESFLYYYD